MRPRSINCTTGQLATGARGVGAWLELVKADDRPAMLELSEGELLMAVEALAAVYAELVGADPNSIARGINRTLRNRTRAARERRHARAA